MSNTLTAKQGGYLHPGPIESFVSNGLKTFDYYFDLPLKHTDTSCKDTIVVFARKVTPSLRNPSIRNPSIRNFCHKELHLHPPHAKH